MNNVISLESVVDNQIEALFVHLKGLRAFEGSRWFAAQNDELGRLLDVQNNLNVQKKKAVTVKETLRDHSKPKLYLVK